jgi:hypothetical protein
MDGPDLKFTRTEALNGAFDALRAAARVSLSRRSALYASLSAAHRLPGGGS